MKKKTITLLIGICLLAVSSLSNSLPSQLRQKVIQEYELFFWLTALELMAENAAIDIETTSIKNRKNLFDYVNELNCSSQKCKNIRTFFYDRKDKEINIFQQVNSSAIKTEYTLEGLMIELLSNIKNSDKIKLELEDHYKQCKKDFRWICLKDEDQCIKEMITFINNWTNGDKLKQLKELIPHKSELKSTEKLLTIVDNKIKLDKKTEIQNWEQLTNNTNDWNNEFPNNIINTQKVPGIFEPGKFRQCMRLIAEHIRGEENITEKIYWKFISNDQPDIAKSIKTTKKEFDLFQKDKSRKENFLRELGELQKKIKNSEFSSTLHKENFTFGHKPKPIFIKFIKENWITLLISLILACSIMFFILNRKKRKPIDLIQLFNSKNEKHTKPLPENKAAINNDLDKENHTHQEQNQLNNEQARQIAQLNNQISNHRFLLEDLQNRVFELEQQEASPATSGGIAGGVASNIRTPTEPQYALRADGQEGFLIKSLSSDISEDFYYIIHETGKEEATYTLIDDPELHISAASTAKAILSDACEYLNRPNQIKTRIETIADGKLQKVNDNEWKIIEKTKIKFV